MGQSKSHLIEPDSFRFKGLIPNWTYQFNTLKPSLDHVAGIIECQLSHYATGHRNPHPALKNKANEGIHSFGNVFVTVV